MPAKRSRFTGAKAVSSREQCNESGQGYKRMSQSANPVPDTARSVMHYIRLLVFAVIGPFLANVMAKDEIGSRKGNSEF